MSDNNGFTLVSPNDLQAKAIEMMLGGRQPETDTDWQICVNFWAWNIGCGLEVAACSLLKTLFNCPLSENQVTQIAEHQAFVKRRRAAIGMILGGSRN